MNTLLRKVLREVLSGILITEPNRRRVGSEEDDASERRGFWDGADLHFGAMDALT